MHAVRLQFHTIFLLAIAVMTAGCGGASDTVVVGLTEQFDVARKQPGPEAFRLENISIDSRLVPAIIVRGQTRLTQHVTVPERGGAFRVTFGLEPQVWRAPGDGVRFSIGVSDGRAFREKYVRLVDPYGQPADRRWHEAVVDLREYGGLTIDVVLNTRAGPAASTDVRNDVAVWAQPVIVSR